MLLTVPRYPYLKTTGGAVNPTLLADIASGAVAVGDTVETVCYTAGTSYGGAAYTIVAAGTGTDDGGSIINAGTVQLAAKLGSVCSVRHFGAIDGTDATVAIQRFLDYTISHPCDTAVLEGTYKTSAGLKWGYNGAPVSKTIYYTGSISLQGTAPIDVMLDIADMHDIRHDGRIQVLGYTLNNLWTGRKCRVGVRVSGCRGSIFGHLFAAGFQQDGVQVNSKIFGNNNFLTFGTIRGIACGTGSTGVNSLTANWSNPVNTGSVNSGGQITTINVDVDNPNPDTDNPVFVRIGSELYFIRGFAPGQLMIYPWLDPAQGTTGTLKYYSGAAAAFVGQDSGVAGVDAIEATNCGIGLAVCSLYGPTVGRVMAQLNGIATVVGRGTNNALLTMSIANLYCEGNDADVVRNSSYPLMGTSIRGTNILPNKCFDLTRPRGVASDLTPGGNAYQNGMLIDFGGGPLTGVKQGQNEQSLRIGLDAVRTTPAQDHVVWRVHAADVRINPPVLDYNRLFGFDHRMVTFLGDGPNDAPLGDVTFTPPAGWTINGSTTPIVRNGFTKPPTFLLYTQIDAKNLILRDW